VTTVEEIDLRELAGAVWRRRVLVAIVTAVCVALAGAYSLLAPKTYESTIMVQVSDQSDPVYATPAAAAGAVGSLTFIRRAGMAAGLTASPIALRKQIKAVAVPDTPFVRIRVRARTPEGARRLAAAVAEAFVAQASEHIAERRRAAEERLAAVNAQLADIGRILAASRDALVQLQSRRALTSEQEGFIRAFTLNAFSLSEGLYGSLLATQKDLTAELLRLQPPKLVEEPVLPDAPSTPRSVVNLSLAFALGLLVSVAGVLAREALLPSRQMTVSPQA
jgi:uncharacterized protein involved in exopolysaccharide biosynthesis